MKGDDIFKLAIVGIAAYFIYKEVQKKQASATPAVESPAIDLNAIPFTLPTLEVGDI